MTIAAEWDQTLSFVRKLSLLQQSGTKQYLLFANYDHCSRVGPNNIFCSQTMTIAAEWDQTNLLFTHYVHCS